MKQYTAKPIMALTSAISASHNDESHPRHWTPTPSGTLAQQTHYAQAVEIRPSEIDQDIVNKLRMKMPLSAQLDACRAPIDAAIIANVLFAHAAHGADTGYARGDTLSLMDLIRLVGWYTGEQAARQQAITQMASWVCSIGASYVDVGWWEKKKMPKTRKKGSKPSRRAIEHYFTQMMQVTVTLYEGGLDGDVQVAPSPWLFAIENRPAWFNQYLPAFDEVLRLPSSGTASGAWARCLALNLRWFWRRYRHQPSTVITLDIDGAPRLQYRPISRRDLLSIPYSVSAPTLHALLHDPHRAARYWQGAIDRLHEAGIIAHLEIVTEPPAVADRKGWLDAWLETTLDITPSPYLHAALLSLTRRGEEEDEDVQLVH